MPLPLAARWRQRVIVVEVCSVNCQLDTCSLSQGVGAEGDLMEASLRGSVLAAALALLPLSTLVGARADNVQYGNLGFSRLSPDQEQFFWKRLNLLAFEEAVVSYCGQPDDFEEKAKTSIQSCVTAEALSKADTVFRNQVTSNVAQFAKDKRTCKSQILKQQGWLGITSNLPANGDGSGAPVANVDDGTPAEAAGIKVGDVIIAVNGQDVKDVNDLRAKIGPLGPDAIAKISIQRGGAKQLVSVKLGSISYESDGKVAMNMPPLIKTSSRDLKDVLDQITGLCQKCKTPVWALFCK
jgi:membrane-associated protease RseP (regulator of RpoE activity)